MSSIQDIHAISIRCGRASLNADAKDDIEIGNTTLIYPLSTMVRPGDNNAQERDSDKISDIANTWLFLN